MSGPITRRKPIRAAALVAVALAVSPLSLAAEGHRVALCYLKSHLATFQGFIVEVRGQAEPLLETTNFGDVRCRTAPVLRLGDEAEGADSASLGRFFNARADALALNGRRGFGAVFVTIVGRVEGATIRPISARGIQPSDASQSVVPDPPKPTKSASN